MMVNTAHSKKDLVLNPPSGLCVGGLHTERYSGFIPHAVCGLTSDSKLSVSLCWLCNRLLQSVSGQVNRQSVPTYFPVRLN